MGVDVEPFGYYLLATVKQFVHDGQGNSHASRGIESPRTSSSPVVWSRVEWIFLPLNSDTCISERGVGENRMGEGSELLEELLDLGVPLDTRVFESDSSEMMNILTTSLSHSWNPEALEESPTRGSVRNVHPWGVDFQTHAHETSNDEPFATTPVGSILSGTTHHCVQQQHRNVRGEGEFRASTPPTSWPVPEAGVVETALTGNSTGDKENGLMNSGRRSTRFRKVTERFDPVNIDAEVCRVADVGRCAQKRDWKKETDVKIAGKRAKLEKMPSLKGKRAADVNGHLTCNQQPAMRLPSRRAASSHAAKFFKQASKGNANRGGRAGSSNQSSENAQMERGKHVGSKPQMQKTARAGQRRWKALLSKMRAEAEISMPTSKNFGKQITEVGTGHCEENVRQEEGYFLWGHPAS